jgi:hypothetical protein
MTQLRGGCEEMATINRNSLIVVRQISKLRLLGRNHLAENG